MSWVQQVVEWLPVLIPSIGLVFRSARSARRANQRFAEAEERRVLAELELAAAKRRAAQAESDRRYLQALLDGAREGSKR